MIPLTDAIERIVIVTVDCLRWDHHEPYRDLYPPGVWFRATTNATYNLASHASALTGLNPPRHGIFEFGETAQHETLLSQFDSVTHSIFCHNDVYEDTTETVARNFPHPKIAVGNDIVTKPWQLSADDLQTERERDLVFLHDWVVQRSSPGGADADWIASISPDQSPDANADAYRQMRDESLVGHERLLDMLKAEDMYEDTLFVVWGDHGQAFGMNESGAVGHGIPPWEEVARVPIGFCSPAFSETRVNTRVNPRGIDIAPSVCSLAAAADIPYEPFGHEMEGVDLSESVAGSLLGYTVSGPTHLSGSGDGARSRERGFVSAGQDYQYTVGLAAGRETPTSDAEWLRDYYRDVRAGHTTGRRSAYVG